MHGNSIKVDIYTFQVTNTSNVSVYYGQYYAVGLVENITNYGNVTQVYMNNQYIYSNILRTNITGTSPYYFADGRVGTAIYNTNYHWYIVQNENYIRLEEIEELINGGYLSGLLLTDTMLEQLNQIDNCYLIYGDTNTTKYQSDNFVLKWQTIPIEIPSGTITNQSGEVTRKY